LREASTLGLLILLIAAQVVSHKSDPLFRKTDEMVSVSLMNGFRSLAGVSLVQRSVFSRRFKTVMLQRRIRLVTEMPKARLRVAQHAGEHRCPTRSNLEHLVA
jgi:hypothetical protein